ncbi:hypothetical protein EG329_003092 [Mollisiaceae sp. DMI_Dod_QoI]|nr:hypothetical protein EG329_003092 [Helotiales sp. DMI_Dod_QoI]
MSQLPPNDQQNQQASNKQNQEASTDQDQEMEDSGHPLMAPPRAHDHQTPTDREAIFRALYEQWCQANQERLRLDDIVQEMLRYNRFEATLRIVRPELFLVAPASSRSSLPLPDPSLQEQARELMNRPILPPLPRQQQLRQPSSARRPRAASRVPAEVSQMAKSIEMRRLITTWAHLAETSTTRNMQTVTLLDLEEALTAMNMQTVTLIDLEEPSTTRNMLTVTLLDLEETSTAEMTLTAMSIIVEQFKDKITTTRLDMAMHLKLRCVDGNRTSRPPGHDLMPTIHEGDNFTRYRDDSRSTSRYSTASNSSNTSSRTEKRTSSRRRGGARCFTYNKTGHFAYACPENKDK